MFLPVDFFKKQQFSIKSFSAFNHSNLEVCFAFKRPVLSIISSCSSLLESKRYPSGVKHSKSFTVTASRLHFEFLLFQYHQLGVEVQNIIVLGQQVEENSISLFRFSSTNDLQI